MASEELIDLKSEFPPLNYCMYCGATEGLSREHIVPYGLGGPGAIPRSSCDECAKITTKFEREVLRGPLWGLRAYLRLSSRRKREMPTHLPLTIVRKEEQEEISVPITEHPILLTLPVFAVPSNISTSHVEGIRIRGGAAYNFGKPIKEVLRLHNADDVRVLETSRPVALARMLAKIAWAVAVANGQRERLDPRLRDALLYQPNEIGRWVGNGADDLVAAGTDRMHEVQIREHCEHGWLFAVVQLFANVRTPRYTVLLGRL